MNEIVIILLLVLLNGLFSMAEIALISARKSSLTSDAKRGSRSARMALKLADEPDRFLSTVQIGITLIGILTGIYSGSKIATVFSEWLAEMGITLRYSEAVAQIVIVAIVTYLTLVFGELLPKRIGMSASEKVAKLVARPMYLLSVAALPFVSLLSGSTTALFNILGLKNKGSKVTEDEIKSIINEGKEDGEIQEVEQDIVERVFLMGDLNVDSIMTHKRELVWFDVSMDSRQVREIMNERLFELYPVADGDLDHIIGFVSMKSLIFTLDAPDFSLKSLVTPPIYFYRNMSVYKVLEIMKSEGVGRGLVCDEFGSCIGIITLKDIMHGLVGTVNDGDTSEPTIVKRSNVDEWIVDGQCFIYDFLKYFDCVDMFENEDYNTVAGLCLAELEHIPSVGESFKWHIFIFEITDMDGARIDKLLVRIDKDATN